jgi:hypothetical protein
MWLPHSAITYGPRVGLCHTDYNGKSPYHCFPCSYKSAKEAPMRIVFLCLALLSLSSCGFEPVHGKKSATKTVASTGGLDLSAVAIHVDRSRLGQLLEAEISDRIHPSLTSTSKRYDLVIQLTESESARFIRQDGTAARGDFIYNSVYSLTDTHTNQVIDRGSIKRISSYNIADSADYATYVTLEDARERGVIAVAHAYALRLANVNIRAAP